MDWTVFGWAGIQLEIPTTWELSGLSGDQKTGYLRLDDAEMPRLELKWAHTRRKKPCLLYTSPSPRDRTRSRMPSSA